VGGERGAGVSLRVVPLTRQELPGWRKLLIGVEVLVTYARIRWLIRDEDAMTAVPRIRGREAPAERFPGTPEQTYLAGRRLGHIVIRTLNPLPYDSRCLFRSLTLSALLQRRGIEGKLIIAVRPQPFAAHAWVEHDGHPLLPPGEPGFERIAEL
jgi:hypothetical protein